MRAALLALCAALAIGQPARAAPASLTEWPGLYGGLPPFSRATPAAMEAAFEKAVAGKRAEIRAIADNPARPTFANTVLAFEESGGDLDRVIRIINAFSAVKSDDAVRALQGRVTPVRQTLEDEILLDPRLFARVKAVRDGLPASAPDADARRLTEVLYDRMVRAGAALSSEARARLVKINARLAELGSTFDAHLGDEETKQFILVRDAARLKGLSERDIETARRAAAELGHADAWVFHNRRPEVWVVAGQAQDRELRRDVWTMWMKRGQNPGPNDNGPVTAEMLRLRGEKAALFGYPSYAHYILAQRMAGTPERALSALEQTWATVRPDTERRIAEMQALAKAEGADITIEPWDYLYYENRLKARLFSVDPAEVQSYLQLDRLVDGMMWSAGRLYGYRFKELRDVDRINPDVRVFEVSKGGRPIGVIYLDLYFRTGKQRGSWTNEYRSAQNREPRVIPVAVVTSSVPTPPPGRPATVAVDVATVLFHEFGHALHMISSASPYASTGSLAAPWDFIEVPSLFNERWLWDEELLSRFAVHETTGRPMPPELIAKVKAAARYDRVFSVGLAFLGTALVDLKVHMMTDGRPIDAAAEETRILRELALPPAVDLTMRALQSHHMFSESYGASVYTYLWSDMIAADISEAFTQAPNGPYDPEVAARWYRTILSRGGRVPIDQAFREFRGRDPDPAALMRRFDW